MNKYMARLTLRMAGIVTGLKRFVAGSNKGGLRILVQPIWQTFVAVLEMNHNLVSPPDAVGCDTPLPTGKPWTPIKPVLAESQDSDIPFQSATSDTPILSEQ